MASFIFSKTLILFLAINLLLFSLVSACGQCGSGNPNPNPNPNPYPNPNPNPNPYPNPNPNPKPTPKPSTPYPGTGGGRPSTGGGGSTTLGACPRDALKLGVCANVLNGLLNLNIGKPPKTPCCPLIQGLVDAEAAVCLCTAIKANILGINLNIPISLSLLVNYCGTSVPRGFQCA